MKRFLAMCAAVGALGGEWQGKAQGSVHFTNFGAAFIDIFGDGVPVKAGWTVQLSFTDGTPIGDPAPILFNGIFSDGSRVVPGFAPGESVDLILKVSDPTGGIKGTLREPFSVVLGGGIVPPARIELPSLAVHTVVDISRPICSDWTRLKGIPCDGEGTLDEEPLWLLEFDGTTHPRVPGDAGQPVPPPPPKPAPIKSIQYRLLANGKLELRWPRQYTLLRSRLIAGARVTEVSSKSSEGDLNVWSAGTTAAQFFFWLE